MGLLLVAIAAFAGLGGFLFGYDLGLIGGAVLGIQRELKLSSFGVELVVGAFKLGACIGTLLGGAFMLRYGRQQAIAFSSVFFTIGPLAMSVAQGSWLLVSGRFICGVGTGSAAIVVPSYLAELSPAEYRGAVVQIYEVMLCIGVLAASLVDWLLNDMGPHSWRAMVGLPALLGITLAASPWLLPESPRWLVMRGRLPEALEVLQRLIQGNITAPKPPPAARSGSASQPHADRAARLGGSGGSGDVGRYSKLPGADTDPEGLAHNHKSGGGGNDRDERGARTSTDLDGGGASPVVRPQPIRTQPVSRLSAMSDASATPFAHCHDDSDRSDDELNGPGSPSGVRREGSASTGGAQRALRAAPASASWLTWLWNGDVRGPFWDPEGVAEMEAAAAAARRAVLQRAEDELLLLWSSVEKDKAAALEHRAGSLTPRSAGRQGQPSRTGPLQQAPASPHHRHQLESVALFTIDDDDDETMGAHPTASLGRVVIAPPRSTSNANNASSSSGGVFSSPWRRAWEPAPPIVPKPHMPQHIISDSNALPDSPAGGGRDGQGVSGGLFSSSSGRGGGSGGGSGGNGGGGGGGSGGSGWSRGGGWGWWGGYARLQGGDDSGSGIRGSGRPNGRRSDNAASSASAYAPGEEPSFWHTLWYMLRDMALVAVGPERRALFIAIGLAFFDQAMASSAVVNYAPLIIKEILASAHPPPSRLPGLTSHPPPGPATSSRSSGQAEEDPTYEAAAMLFGSIIGAAKLVGVVLALLFVDRWGRRPLLMLGSAGCAAGLAAATVAAAMGSVEGLVATLSVFILSMSLSWAGVFWIVVSELFSMAAKSPAVSAATGTLFLTGSLTNITFLSSVHAAGPYGFLLFATISAAGGVFVWAFLPETKGKTLLEIQDMMARQSRSRGGSPSMPSTPLTMHDNNNTQHATSSVGVGSGGTVSGHGGFAPMVSHGGMLPGSHMVPAAPAVTGVGAFHYAPAPGALLEMQRLSGGCISEHVISEDAQCVRM